MAAEDKNKRATRMIHSSLNAPAKKGGAGGGYTWGSALDVADYEPTDYQGIVGSVGVVTSPVAVSTPTVVASGPATSFQMDQSAFPTLGAAPAVVPVTSWGPGTMNRAVVGEAAIRPGVVVGQQQPRNLFARKARPQPTQVVATQVEGGMIDWSNSGMPVETMQAIVRQAAHLGPYQAQGTTTLPLDTLRTRNAGTVLQQQAVAPAIIKQPVAQSNAARRAQHIIQQPR